jgi:hypothetical protein
VSKTRGMNRRTFLRGTAATGAGIAVGLPLFDAMTNLTGTAHAGGTALPRRFVLYFWGNGLQWGPRAGGGLEAKWAPTMMGAGWDVPEGHQLYALRGVREHINVVSGTDLPIDFSCNQDYLGTPDTGRRFGCDKERARNPHVEGACAMLTGTNPVFPPGYVYGGDEGDINWAYLSVGGPSIDRTMAELLGPTRPLVTAVTPLGGSPGSPGTVVRYASHLGTRSPVEPEMSPRRLFDSLFTSGVPSMPTETVEPASPEMRARASVLDAVLEDAHALQLRLGAEDRALLDLHMTEIRALELELGGGHVTPGEACVPGEAPTATSDYAQTARDMGRVVSLAFACDLSRVAVIQLSSPATESSFGLVLDSNGADNGFHGYMHTRGYDANTLAVGDFSMRAYAEFVGMLRDRGEAGATLLDRSVVLGTSELSGGQLHHTADMPLIVAGRADGQLRYPGIHLDGAGRNSTEMMLTLLRALGSTAASWGQDQFRVTEELAIRV